MTLMYALLAAAAAVSTTPSNGYITQFLRDTLNVYDAQGNSLGQRSRDKLIGKNTENLHIVIIGEDPKHHVGAKVGGETLYFRNIEVVTEGRPGTCQNTILAARAADQHIAAVDVGARQGLASQSAGCIQEHPKP